MENIVLVYVWFVVRGEERRGEAKRENVIENMMSTLLSIDHSRSGSSWVQRSNKKGRKRKPTKNTRFMHFLRLGGPPFKLFKFI